MKRIILISIIFLSLFDSKISNACNCCVRSDIFSVGIFTTPYCDRIDWYTMRLCPFLGYFGPGIPISGSATIALASAPGTIIATTTFGVLPVLGSFTGLSGNTAYIIRSGTSQRIVTTLPSSGCTGAALTALNPVIATCTEITAKCSIPSGLTPSSCVQAIYLEMWTGTTPATRVNYTPINGINIGLATSNKFLPIAPATCFPSGTYYYRFRYTYAGCSTSTSYSAWSNTISFTLSGSTLNAGIDKTTPSCSTCVQLAATATTGGKWTIYSQNGSGDYFDNIIGKTTSTNANAWFCFGTSNVCTLKWEGPCCTTPDYMVVTLYSPSHVCGTNYTEQRAPYDVYPTTLINGKCWYAKNLNYGTQITFTSPTNASQPSYPATSSSAVYKYCFNNSSSNCSNYGGLYLGDFATASNLLCECGWHVATDDEWESLKGTNTDMATIANSLRGSTPNNFNAATAYGIGWLYTNFINPYYVWSFGNNSCFNGSSNANGCWDYRPGGSGARSTWYWTGTYSSTGVGGVPVGPGPYSSTNSGYAKSRWFHFADISNPTNPYSNIWKQSMARRAFALNVRCVKN